MSPAGHRVKICGITDAAAFDACVAAGADWIGFVFFARSPRNLSAPAAASLSARHAGGPARVALFVDPSDDEVARVVDTLHPDILQLHAPIPRALELRARFNRPVWRTAGIAQAEDLPDDAEGMDALLIESKAPPDATRPGGNASRFDWGLLTGWTPDFDWLLAGGLTPDNVGEAKRVTVAPAYDVSSGVESAPGKKDPKLIEDFIRMVRG